MNEFEERNNINESVFGFDEDKSNFSKEETAKSEENYSFDDIDVISADTQLDDGNMTVVEESEHKAPEVKIDLNGGYGNQGYSGYRENVGNKREKRQNRKFIAVIAALTAINFVFVLGAFFVGRTFGTTNRRIASRQELIETMQTPSAESGAINAANIKGEMPTTEIAKKVGPAVVGITSTVQGQMSIFGTSTTSKAEGSGIILSADGYIVTNNHVVDGATTVMVLLNTGTEYEAKLVGKDEQTDLAVIKIEPTEELTVATMGDSNALEVGERVVAIGNPMGLEFFGSVTEGIVSGVNRTISIDNRTLNLIQTDAAINSGNSGGALINTKGEVIGINSVKLAYSGVESMGFAIPSTEAKVIIADLLEYGYVKGRPVIGIATRDVTDYMAQAYSWPKGVQVMEISTENARNAGFQQGDIITEVNGQKVSTGEELNRIKGEHNPGDVLKMKVYKYSTGLTEMLDVTLSEQIPG